MKFSLLLAAAATVAATTLDNVLRSALSEAGESLFPKLEVRQTPPPGGEFPIIDLGYVKQQATSYATAGNVSYYVFKNIRFAAPPLGELRFRKPAPPSNEKTVQNGTYPGPTACVSPGILGGGSTGSEDCLFLDVWMPVGSKHRMPVLANWYGGGYIAGTKETGGNPASLYRSTGEKFVYVAPNYRLGAFGWLAPPGEDWTPNAGLHDTLAAMNWIKTHIQKFNGDTRRVTAMGLSAGAGVVVNAMVSRTGTLPFQQAILQSPGWQPEMSKSYRKPLYDAFAANANCSGPASVKCLRSAPTEQLIAANTVTIGTWNADLLGPTSGFYPVPDADILPLSVPNAMASGRFHREVRSVITSSARWEAGSGPFAPAYTTDEEFMAGLSTITNKPASQQRIAALYPSDGTPTSGFNRGRDFVADFGFNCNSYWTNVAFSRRGHIGRKYMFNIGTAGHGSDGAFTWGSTAISPLVQGHQEWIVDYVVSGNPGIRWPEWKREGGSAVWLNSTGLGVAEDYYKWEVNANRCKVLREEIYERS